MFVDQDGTHIVQLVRGKLLVSEMVVVSGEIAYVYVHSNPHDEHIFDCMVETPEGTDVAYHFVLAHSFEPEATDESRRWTH